MEALRKCRHFGAMLLIAAFVLLACPPVYAGTARGESEACLAARQEIQHDSRAVLVRNRSAAAKAADDVVFEVTGADGTYTADEEDEELIAALIFCEAGNQPYEGMVAIGNVVLNRVKSSSFPNTIRDVIFESGQFYPALNGWLQKVIREDAIPEECMKAAGDALRGADPAGKSLYFERGTSGGIVIGAHVFSETME